MPTAPQTYEEATYASPWWIVRYPHRIRAERALDLVIEDEPRTVLDYGAGGGELITRLLADPRAVSVETAIAYDPYETDTGHLADRLGGHPRAAVAVTLEQAAAALGGRRVDAVACMGVLEHLPLRERRRFFAFCTEALAPTGRVVIDVPVESGTALLVKTFGRRVLKRRPPEYTAGELVRAVAGRPRRDPERWGGGADPDFIYTHKGFDLGRFRAELSEHQEIIRTVATPVSWLPGWSVNQEVIFVSRPRPVEVAQATPAGSAARGAGDPVGRQG